MEIHIEDQLILVAILTKNLLPAMLMQNYPGANA